MRINFFLIIFFTVASIAPSYSGHLNSKHLAKEVSFWNSFGNKKFQLCKIKNKKRKPKIKIKKIKIHFDNDSDYLSENESEKILSGFEKHFDSYVEKLEIIGHADTLGSDAYNLRLSNKRLNRVIEFLNYHRKQLITHSIKVMTDYKGEKKSKAHRRDDRYVEIRFIKKYPVTHNFKRIYLIDGSFSMKSRRTVSGYRFFDLQKMNIPKDTLVYVVRDNYGGCVGDKLQNYTPKGTTFVREAMGVFARHMRGKIHFVTFTDGIEPLSLKEEKYIDDLIYYSVEEHKIKWSVR